MRSTLGLVVCLGMAWVGAREMEVHDEHRMLLDNPAAFSRNTSVAINSSLPGNIISGMYLVEFSDGHVGLHLPKVFVIRC